MNKLIAYCGLDCETCDAYLATANDSRELREKTAKLWSELNNVPILPEHINCQGCRADGIKTVFCESMCEIRKCAIKRKNEICADCSDLETCPAIQSFLKKNPSASKNLKPLY